MLRGIGITEMQEIMPTKVGFASFTSQSKAILPLHGLSCSPPDGNSLVWDRTHVNQPQWLKRSVSGEWGDRHVRPTCLCVDYRSSQSPDSVHQLPPRPTVRFPPTASNGHLGILLQPSDCNPAVHIFPSPPHFSPIALVESPSSRAEPNPRKRAMID